jgi:hypothetical protein
MIDLDDAIAQEGRRAEDRAATSCERAKEVCDLLAPTQRPPPKTVTASQSATAKPECRIAIIIHQQKPKPNVTILTENPATTTKQRKQCANDIFRYYTSHVRLLAEPHSYWTAAAVHEEIQLINAMSRRDRCASCRRQEETNRDILGAGGYLKRWGGGTDGVCCFSYWLER